MPKGSGAKRQNHTSTKKASALSTSKDLKVSTESTVFNFEDNSEEGESDDFDEMFDLSECIDMLLAKKGKQRETAMKSAIDFLRSSACSPESSTSVSLINMLEEPACKEGICLILLRLAKKCSKAEAELILTILPLFALLVGEEQDKLYLYFHTTLKSLVTGGKKSLKGIGATALLSLSFTSYVCASLECNMEVWVLCETLLCHGLNIDISEADELLNLSTEQEKIDESDSDNSGWDESSSDDSQGVGNEEDEISFEVKAQAAQCWVLLATLMPVELVLAHSRRRGVFSALTRLLYDSRDTDHKVAAGRALAFLWEVGEEYREVVKERQNDRDNNCECEDWDIHSALCSSHNEVAEFIRTLQAISKNSLKKISKKERKEQKAEFRDIEDWVVKRESPFEGQGDSQIRMQGAVIEVDTFARQTLVGFLRQVLGSGFHHSLHSFPVVRDLMEVGTVTNHKDGDGLTAKVDKGSSTDKKRSANRKQERQFRDINREYGGEHLETGIDG